ncbi:MAG: NADH-quinone oxidoreductase subunit L [Pirellulaceae bacterium]|jgi:NADH-quinone oxidoreductase subunit L|nr:NADH-quinone oxidoreductase subunit L [Pirellulaceae bacterium]
MNDWIRLLMWLVPALPLAAAVTVAALGPRVLRGASHWPVLIALATSCLASLLLLGHVRQQPVGFERVESYWTWAAVGAAGAAPQDAEPGVPDALHPRGDLVVDIALRLDTLTSVMLTMVTFISFLVAVYSVGYMRGDRGYWRFFAYIALFVFSMTMLVSVSNFVLLFVFWEAVGVCSYLLIGFWYQKPAAAAAGKKAFLVNRVGDFGFMLGVFLIWTTYGSMNYHDVPRPAATAVVFDAAASAGQTDAAAVQPGVLGAERIRAQAYVGGGTGFAICMLLLLGACGKSAQFPLHVWLPDAMEGPTPVSALIHAATMVTAGVYMVARCTPLFGASPEAQMVVAAVGTFTALLAGLIALTQFDLKRVLAYSTVSQLGFMFLGLGTGTLAGITGGMFHLVTHAFFKALLFLSAGSVMHAMGNVIDMRQFSGLRKLMPYTFATFLIGSLALAGIAPLSGFWSKDAILAAVHGKAHVLEEALDARHELLASGEAKAFRTVAWMADAPAVHAAPDVLAAWSEVQLERGARLYGLLYYTAVFVAFLTSVYTFRMLYLTFYGPLRVPAAAGDHAHESPRVMVVPLVILAVGAALAGLWMDRSYLNGTHPFAQLLEATPSLTGAVAGTEALGAFHFGPAATSTAVALAGIALASGLYLAAGGSARREAVGGSIWYRLSYGKFYLDEVYDMLVVRPLAGLAWLWARADDAVVDGLVDTVGRLPLVLGRVLRSLQTGLVQFYALAMVVGGLLLLLLSDPELTGRMWTWLGGVWSSGVRP